MATDTPKQEFLQRIEIDDAAFSEIPIEVSEDQIEWEKFIDEMSDGIEYAKITIYRVPTNAAGMPMKKGMAYLFECGLSDYTFSQLCSTIRDQYKSGVYRIQVRDKGGVLRKNKQIAIEAPASPETNSENSDAGNVIDRMSVAMSQQTERFEMMMRGAPQADPIDQMTKMMAAMGAMMAAMGLGAQNQAPPKTPLENMMEMKMMKEIAGELFSTGETPNGESGFWGAMGNIAQGLGGPLMAAIAAGQQSGAVSADGVIQLPAPAAEVEPQPEKPTPINTDAESQTMNLESMKMQLSFLANQAKNGVPVADSIKFVVDALPEDDEILDSLENFLQREDCIDQMILVVPEVGNHKAYFAEWIRGMLFELDKMVESQPLTLEGELDENAGSDAGGVSDTEETANDASTEPPDDSSDTDGNPDRDGGHKSDT